MNVDPPTSNERVLPTHTTELFQRAVERAAERLAEGAVVALPTETVYGLAANALDLQAVQKVFEIKGRPTRNPLIVHVANLDMARTCVSEWPALASRLAGAFWPGPLTLVLRKSRRIPDIVTAGGPTVGIRWPAHPMMRAVIERCGFPLAAPSANPSNQVSPTRADHVLADLAGRVSLIVDGGTCQVGIESTVIDLTCDPPRVLRPGMIHFESLLAVTGRLALGSPVSGDALRSPGLLPKHYAPRAKLRVVAWNDDAELADCCASLQAHPDRVHVIAHGRVPMGTTFKHVCVIPHDPEAFARAIYAELRRCDSEGAEWILVERLPDGPEWRAVVDRLERASR